MTQSASQGAFDFEYTNYGGVNGRGRFVEGAVAAYFVDLVDPVQNAPPVERDLLAVPFLLVTGVIDNCQSKINGSWQGTFDLQEFRLCFENRPNGTTVRFSPSSPVFSPAPTTWSLANMSNDYVWNVDGNHN